MDSGRPLKGEIDLHEDSMPANPAPGANIARVLFSVSKGGRARRDPHSDASSIQSVPTCLKSESSSISNAFKVEGVELPFPHGSLEVGSSLRKRKAGDEVPQSVDRPSKRLSVEDHFSRDEVVQALMERVDSLVAKNKDLELSAIKGDAKARENEGNLELELEKIKYRLMEKEGGVASLEGAIWDLESQLQEQRDKKDNVDWELDEEIEKKWAAEREVKSLTEELSGSRDLVKTLEAQLEKAEQRIKVRDEQLEQIHSHGRQLFETIESGLAQICKSDEAKTIRN